jgi:hypothetical protein
MGVMKKKKQDILEIEMPASLSVSFPKMPCVFLHSATYPVKEIFTSSGNYLVHHSMIEVCTIRVPLCETQLYVFSNNQTSTGVHLSPTYLSSFVTLFLLYWGWETLEEVNSEYPSKFACTTCLHFSTWVRYNYNTNSNHRPI